MQQKLQGARVRVCASTSNLGPGFDCLGLALSVWLDVELRWDDPAREARVQIASGCAKHWPQGADNLLVRAWNAGCAALGVSPHGASFVAHSDIPVCRGLGSSGAAIIAGLLLANWRHGNRLERDQLLALALDLEGHPDNVTASLLGGLTLGVPLADKTLVATTLDLHPSLAFAIAWPDAPLSTAAARAVLPLQVPLADAVENARRLALLLEGLRRGQRAWIEAGSQDRLHVACRLPLIPGAAQALAAAREHGAWTATISGSGSAMLAICDADCAPAAAAAMGRAFQAASAGGDAQVVAAVRAAPQVVPT